MLGHTSGTHVAQVIDQTLPAQAKSGLAPSCFKTQQHRGVSEKQNGQTIDGKHDKAEHTCFFFNFSVARLSDPS